MINVPEGTLRQWERDFEGVLVIPRDQQNSRYYSDVEIETLNHIKTMREKDLSKAIIKELLSKRESEDVPTPVPVTVPQMKQNEVLETLRNIQKAFETLPEVKQMIVDQVKSELKEEIQETVRLSLENSRKQIAASIEAGNNNTSEQLKALSESITKIENNKEEEIKRRDQLLLENLNVMRELKEYQRQMKEDQDQGFFKRLFKRNSN